MENSQKTTESISHVSSYAVSVFFVAFVLGVLFDELVVTYKVIPDNLAFYLGLTIAILGTLLLFWSFRAGCAYHTKRQVLQVDKTSLASGPFRFSRNPHYLGISILIIGFGLIINSLAIVLLSLLATVFVHLYFIPREERVLRERHGKEYDDYHSSTRQWF